MQTSESKHREQQCKSPEAGGYLIHPRNGQEPSESGWPAMRSEVLGSQITHSLIGCYRTFYRTLNFIQIRRDH